ncbi:MAG: hypothetical protein ACKVTZ_16010 [Bacteroidia bacterium]
MRKKTLFTLCSLCLGLFYAALAQDTTKVQGTIIYELRNYPPPAFSRFSDKVSPKVTDSLISPVNVHFNGNWVRYEDSLVAVNQAIPNPNSPYYSGMNGWLTSNKMLYVMHQFQGKQYYTEEVLAAPTWRFALTIKQNLEYENVFTKAQATLIKMNEPKSLTLTDEYRDIMGYKCRKAIYDTRISSMDGSGDKGIIAFWFTNEIKANVSPIPCNLVEGVILELVAHRVLYKAKRIVFAEPPKKLLAIPQDGYKISIAEEEQRIVWGVKENDQAIKAGKGKMKKK